MQAFGTGYDFLARGHFAEWLVYVTSEGFKFLYSLVLGWKSHPVLNVRQIFSI